jgi:hypothetical protein
MMHVFRDLLLGLVVGVGGIIGISIFVAIDAAIFHARLRLRRRRRRGYIVGGDR